MEKLNLWPALNSRTNVKALGGAAGAGDEEERRRLLFTHCPPPHVFFTVAVLKAKLGVVQVLHSDDYNATRVQYITLISHTGAQWYHN